MIKNAFAFCFQEARLSTTGESDLEHDKNEGQNSTVMHLITSNDGALLSHFDKINETQAEINNNSLKHMPNDDHEIYANKGKNKGQLSLENVFGFCKTFKTITKFLGFRLTFKTSNLVNFLYNTYADPISLTNFDIQLFVPRFIPSAAIQASFNDSIEDPYSISLDSWYTDRAVGFDGLEFQIDLGSAENVKIAKYLIVAHQTLARVKVPNKSKSVATFNNLDVRQKFCEIDGQRNAKDGIVTNYAEMIL